VELLCSHWTHLHDTQLKDLTTNDVYDADSVFWGNINFQIFKESRKVAVPKFENTQVDSFNQHSE
jgi:hypothetical protein